MTCTRRGVRVETIHPFGVFVEVLPGQSGLVHVSELDTERTNDPADKVRTVYAPYAGLRVLVRRHELFTRAFLTGCRSPPQQPGRPSVFSPKLTHVQRVQVKVGDLMDVMCLELLPGKKMKLSRCNITILTTGSTCVVRILLRVICIPMPCMYAVAKRCIS